MKPQSGRNGLPGVFEFILRPRFHADEMQTKESRRHWIWLAFAVSGLPVFYVLSHGPWWFMLAHRQPPPIICSIGDTFFSPIWSLYYGGMISEDLFGVFMDYNSWWVSLGGDPPQTIQPIL